MMQQYLASGGTITERIAMNGAAATGGLKAAKKAAVQASKKKANIVVENFDNHWSIAEGK